MVLFLGNCQQLPEQTFHSIYRWLKKCDYREFFAIIQTEDCRIDHRHEFDQLLSDVSAYDFYDEESLLACLKQLMAVHASVRVRNLQIKVRCLTGEMDLKQPASYWKQEDPHIIVRRYTSLGNICVYKELVMVESVANRHVEFEVEIRANYSTGTPSNKPD